MRVVLSPATVPLVTPGPTMEHPCGSEWNSAWVLLGLTAGTGSLLAFFSLEIERNSTSSYN